MPKTRIDGARVIYKAFRAPSLLRIQLAEYVVRSSSHCRLQRGAGGGGGQPRHRIGLVSTSEQYHYVVNGSVHHCHCTGRSGDPILISVSDGMEGIRNEKL